MDQILRVKEWEKYQHYKKKNKNYNNEQKWFMFYGRRYLMDHEFMSLTIEQREFLVMSWCIGSQDNGFLPSVYQIAFLLRRSNEVVEKLLQELFDLGWYEPCNADVYDLIQEEQELVIEENRNLRAKELRS
tara:strand:+ start:1625 stop:2017 length:393 start_codon:yes stop_codon:yes gene_type:complete